LRNRGELSEGWYDPSTLQKAVQSAATYDSDPFEYQRPKSPARRGPEVLARGRVVDESDSDDSIGPTLPGQDGRSRGSRMGPSIPNMQDLELKRGKVIAKTSSSIC
jgi:hypothetical protein